MNGLIAGFLNQAIAEYGLNCLACPDFSKCGVIVNKKIAETCKKENLGSPSSKS